MNFIDLILEECTAHERQLIGRSLHVVNASLILSDTEVAYSRGPYAECLQIAKEKEDACYARRGWWDERGCGPVPFRDVPEYRFRGQDLEIHSDLVARDRAEEKKEALQKRQSAWRRAQRSMGVDWQSALTRSLKSG